MKKRGAIFIFQNPLVSAALCCPAERYIEFSVRLFNIKKNIFSLSTEQAVPLFYSTILRAKMHSFDIRSKIAKLGQSCDSNCIYIVRVAQKTNFFDFFKKHEICQLHELSKTYDDCRKSENPP